MKSLKRNILLLFISLTLAALFCQLVGDDWEEKLRQALYKLTNDSIPTYTKTIPDEKGIPYVHYTGQHRVDAGDRYNPTIIANYAINYYKQLDDNKDSLTESRFSGCIDWLIKNISDKGEYALYEFGWRQPFYDSVNVPWTSGMTSGRSIEAFTAAYRRYHKKEYLHAANKLLKGFYQPIQAGGFTYKDTSGWWFEEFSDSNMHTPRILDGHIFALTGVYQFWQLTKSDSALFVFQQGIHSLKSHLPAYDRGDGWSYYDIYRTASDKKYHMLLTTQMKELWQMTHDPIFLRYYRAWKKPLNRPYVYRILMERNRSGLILYLLLSGLLFSLLYWGYRSLGKHFRGNGA